MKKVFVMILMMMLICTFASAEQSSGSMLAQIDGMQYQFQQVKSIGNPCTNIRYESYDENGRPIYQICFYFGTGIQSGSISSDDNLYSGQSLKITFADYSDGFASYAAERVKKKSASGSIYQYVFANMDNTGYLNMNVQEGYPGYTGSFNAVLEAERGRGSVQISGSFQAIS